MHDVALFFVVHGWVKFAHDEIKQDPRTKPKALLKLLEAGEKAKKQLSPVGVTDAPINIECLWEDVSVLINAV